MAKLSTIMAGLFKSYDLNAATDQPTVYIRWGIEPTYADAGWSIDDVELVGDGVPSNPTPADGAEDVSIVSTPSWTACVLVGASQMEPAQRPV